MQLRHDRLIDLYTRSRVILRACGAKLQTGKLVPHSCGRVAGGEQNWDAPGEATRGNGIGITFPYRRMSIRLEACRRQDKDCKCLWPYIPVPD